MKHTLIGLGWGLMCSLMAWNTVGAQENYRIEAITVTQPADNLRRTQFTVRTGEAALDTFDIVRVQRRGLAKLRDNPVILLAPFSFPAEFWELTQTSYSESFAALVVEEGYDLWLVDNRSVQIAPGSCEAGTEDCSPLARFGIDQGINDALFTRLLTKLAHPVDQPVIGGFSGGSAAAIATINRFPHAFSGLFMWEGTLHTADPVIRARNAVFCDQDEALLRGGVIADSSVQGFRSLFDLAGAAPTAQSFVPGFPSGLNNLQALIFAFSVPNAANPLNFTEGFIRLIGDPFAGTLTFSDINRVLLEGPLVGTYAPVRFIRDSHCSIAARETRFVNNLGAFRGDVLVYAERFGFGQMMVDTAALMRRANVTIDFNDEFGESDRYFSRDWMEVAVEPLLDWLDQVHF